MTYQDLLRTDATTLEARQVLRSSPDVLLGVGTDAAGALAALGITTVFDLARSATFGAAAEVLRAASDVGSVESRTGDLPADLFVTPPAVPLASVPGLGLETLRVVASAGLNGRLSESLDVRTIRDLALWPPYVAAKTILDEAADERPVGPEETPNDLLPMSGRYPTERSYYSTFVLADLDNPTPGDRMALEDAGPLDPIAAVSGTGFTRPVRGARLTLAQSWYSQGVALGQLLHSLALAPGESTRVAMIDWSRQQTGTQAERGGQTEQLVGDTTHKRALSEVQNAVATEAQNGFAQTDSRAQQVQAGGGFGLSLGPLTGGGSTGYANSASSANTLTGTSGVRSIAATMTQNVADTTHQAASAARNMFASVVRELSQSEHENISTRVVANYNHMHALTVQYYEVVQIFRTTVELHTFEPCLFVPMKTIDFLAPGANAAESAGALVLRRYRAALQAAAPDAQTRSLLDADAPRGVTIEIRPNIQRALDTQPAPLPPETPDPSPAPVPAPAPQARTRHTAEGTAIDVPDGATLQSVRATFPARRAGLNLPPGSRENTTYITVDQNIGNQGQPFQADLRLPVPLADVTALTLDTEGLQESGFLTLVLGYRGSSLEVDVPIVVFGSSQGEQVMTFRRSDPTEILLTRLAEDPLRYSQAVWRAMDSATVALLLAPYDYAGQPMTQVVDPAPIGTTGNLLIFRMPGEARDLLDESVAGGGLAADGAWLSWVRRHADYETRIEDFVPLPSGGVFAEAVLGRANSAEKLDITRFWNWQDSPIPLTAPDIAPLQAGSRARDDATTPSGLAPPIVAFNNPTALPDPTGLSATLGALANGSLFRDMSGSATTQALALAALAGAGTGATAAGDQGRALAALAAQKEVELAKVAAGLVTGQLGGAGGTVSEKGAKINEGRSLDERAAGAPDKDAATEHEARAAEGESAKAIDLLDKLAAPASSGASGTPAAPAPATAEGEATIDLSSKGDDAPAGAPATNPSGKRLKTRP